MFIMADETFYQPISNILEVEALPDPTNSLTPSQKNALANQYDNELFTMEFYTNTGGGHLRGSPNAQDACMVELVFNEARHEVVIKLVEDTKINKQPQGATSVSIIPGTAIDYGYCFLNFEDSTLQ